MIHIIYDETTGEVLHQIRGSAATAALNTPTGAAALDPVADPVNQELVLVDVSGTPALDDRPGLGIADLITLTDLVAMSLPSEVTVSIDGRPPVAPGTALESEAATIGVDDSIEKPLVVEGFPYRRHVGLVLV